MKKNLVILSGAGMSAESGISTFRDAGGLWDKYPVMQVASAEGYVRDPELVINFYNERRKQLLDVEPNAGHTGLAELEKDFNVTVVTQNVDNLHERAGSTHVIHLHGELTKVCSSRDPYNPRYVREMKPEDFLVKLSQGSSVKKVIGVVSGKGGVGKSMVTSLLAAASMREGFKTAILDGDITGPSIPKAFGLSMNLVGNAEGLILPATTTCGIDIVSVNLMLANETDPVIWRGPVLGGVIKQFWGETLWQNIDYMFIDMPPGTGDVPLTIFQSVPLDGIVIVSSPQELVGMIVEKAVNMARMMNVPILGLVENMSYVECPDCGKQIKVFGESHIDEIAAEYDVPVLAKLPMDPALAAACDAGKIEYVENNYMKDAIEVLKKL